MLWCEFCRDYFDKDHFDRYSLHGVGEDYGPYGAMLKRADETKLEKFGRVVELFVDETLDRFGQFKVVLMIDGKTHFAACFTDMTDQQVWEED